MHLARIFGGWRPRPGGVTEDVQIRKRQALHDAERPFEMRLGLTWEADQQVAPQAAFRHARYYLGDQALVRRYIIMSPHPAQDVVIAALQTDVQVFANLRGGRDKIQ
jgi:hypothetical protein